MATDSEKLIGETLTDSFLRDFAYPGYLPDPTAIIANLAGNYSGPYLEILEQPKQRGFRFRYPCEGPSHGGLPGEYSEKSRKSYPSVQLCNYQGPARIVVSLVTIEDPPMPHAHSLIGRNASNGVVTVQIGAEQGMTASFPNLGIQHVTRKSVGAVLMERYVKMQTLHTATLQALSGENRSMGFDLTLLGDQAMSDGDRSTFDKGMAEAVAEEESRKIRAMVEEQKITMNLSAVRLCFQAYLPDETGSFTKALPPCLSNPVFDSKAPTASNLKICRMDRNSGSVVGNDEVYLLCDRVQRDDIEVRFYEEDESSQVIWEAAGVFSPSDVHRQFAIVFKTPPYWNIATEKPVRVHIELRRKSDRETSESVDFTYQPQMFDQEQIGAKRRKKVPHFQDYFGGGGPPGMGGAAGGGSGIGGFGFTFGQGFSLNVSGIGGFAPSTSTQGGAGTSGKSNSSGQPDSALTAVAWNLAERSSCAMRDYAATGDVRYLLAVQRHLTAVQDDNGDTALHLAVINCQQEVLYCVLDVMAGLPESYVSEFNFLRQSPLHLAAITKQPRALDALLRARADVKSRDRHGDTAMHITCALSDAACLRALLNYNVTKTMLNEQNYQGFTPVHLAVLSGSRELLTLLNSAGADMSIQDGTSGRTPLHHAVEQDNLSVAGFLILEANCDINAVTLDGNTPLHVAAGLGLKGQTALLVAAGADTTLQNRDEETAFDLANVAEVQEILDEEEVVSTESSEDQNLMANMAALSIGQGDLERLDPYIRRKMAQRLDSSVHTGRGWRELANRLALGNLSNAFALHSSPTIQLLAQLEAADGTIASLRQTLLDMRRGDVVEILDECYKPIIKDSGSSGLDSGIDSQSLSARRSEELTSFGQAGSSYTAFEPSPANGMTVVEHKQKAVGFRPIKQPQNAW